MEQVCLINHIEPSLVYLVQNSSLDGISQNQLVILKHEYPRLSFSILNLRVFSPASIICSCLRQFQVFLILKQDQNFNVYSPFSCRHRFSLFPSSHSDYRLIFLYHYSQFSELRTLLLLSPNFLLFRFLILSIV